MVMDINDPNEVQGGYGLLTLLLIFISWALWKIEIYPRWFSVLKGLPKPPVSAIA